MHSSKLRRFLRRNVDRLVQGNKFPLNHAMESVYQTIVRRELSSLGIADTFYPVGGAASYGLMYLLVRTIREFPMKNIVELGAGETTRLLDALGKGAALSANVVSIEHNPDWAKRLSAQVGHEILTANLIPRRIDEIAFTGYDLSAVRKMQAVDLLVVDGPPAACEDNMFARLGAVDLVDLLDENGFVVILDDTERAGEMVLAERMEARIHERRIDFKKGQLISSKRQTIFGGGAYQGAAFF